MLVEIEIPDKNAQDFKKTFFPDDASANTVEEIKDRADQYFSNFIYSRMKDTITKEETENIQDEIDNRLGEGEIKPGVKN